MERASGSRPHNEAYEKVALEDPELDSDGETMAPTSPPGWPPHRGSRRKQRTLLSTFWLCTRVVFVLASAIAWAASLWLTHLASRELGLAHSLIEDPSSGHSSGHGSGHSSSPSLSQSTSSQHSNQPPSCSEEAHHPPSNPPAHSTAFISGGTLPAAGYGLVYNTTYCDGWTDPAGARARGCVLDPSQGGWVHELCHDPALLAEWLRLPDFGWYLDAQRTQRVAQERVWAADVPGGVHTPLFTKWEFHVQHCKFVMRLRIKNAMHGDRGLGYLPLDPGHMNHCLHLMTEDNTAEARGGELTKIDLGLFGGGTEGFGLAGECYMPRS